MKTCTKCGIEKPINAFHKKRAQCKVCRKQYMEQYIADNYDKLRQQHRDSYQRDKKKRQTAVKVANQRSPESFLRHLMHHITKNSTYKRAKKHSNPAVLDVQINFSYLWQLYIMQDGKCARTGIPLDHKWNLLTSMSVDRIDSTKGYVPGNVQIICQFVNLGKNDHSNEEIDDFFQTYHDLRLNGPMPAWK